ncbi:DegV family protein [Niallia sp. Krafla_26]|uniref:DegV family protein n=1 Tax=Niallia sp. Krafla_26 TaxID=3064703 RepID=UPI003D179A6B
MPVKILADSGSDLPLQFYKENDIKLFPLKVLLKDQEYEDLIKIEPKTIFDSIRNGELPKTSQVSPLDFEKTFTEMAQNKEEGVYIAFSSQLSGTYQTAVMMRDQVKESYPEFKLEIIDTKCASLGQGLVVREALNVAKTGATLEEVAKRAEWIASHMEHLFTVPDLDYLAKGGRVSKASAFLGGLLNINPLLNVEDGKLVPLEKIRGRKKVLRRMIEVMRERGVDFDKQTVGISHADDLNTATEMKTMIQDELHAREVIITEIGAVIGSHTGPETIAIFFLNEKPQ